MTNEENVTPGTENSLDQEISQPTSDNELSAQVSALTREVESLRRRRTPFFIRWPSAAKRKLKALGTAWVDQAVPTGKADEDAVKEYPVWIQKMVGNTRGKIGLIAFGGLAVLIYWLALSNPAFITNWL